MLNRVLNLEPSSGALSDTYAAGSEAVGFSAEVVDGALEGAGEGLSRFVEKSDEEEVMMAGPVEARTEMKHRFESDEVAGRLYHIPGQGGREVGNADQTTPDTVARDTSAASGFQCKLNENVLKGNRSYVNANDSISCPPTFQFVSP